MEDRPAAAILRVVQSMADHVEVHPTVVDTPATALQLHRIHQPRAEAMVATTEAEVVEVVPRTAVEAEVVAVLTAAVEVAAVPTAAEDIARLDLTTAEYRPRTSGQALCDFSVFSGIKIKYERYLNGGVFIYLCTDYKWLKRNFSG
jgi:hypothetical protein